MPFPLLIQIVRLILCKFVPFRGLSRRLGEKPAAELALPDSGSVEKDNQTINTAPSMATESEIRSRKHPTEVVWFMLADTTKRLISSPKCRSVEVINNPARPGSNHREVNCINYK